MSAFDPRGFVNVMRAPPAAVLGRELLAEPQVVQDAETGMVLAIYGYKEYHQICVELCFVQGWGIRSELVINCLR